jgi:hypothetical protein
MSEIEIIRQRLSAQLEELRDDDPMQALAAIGAVQRDLADQQEATVRAAATSHSWAEIGAALGISKQAAHQRFAKAWVQDVKHELKREHRRMKAAQRAGADVEAAVAQTKRDDLVAEIKAMAKANRRRAS